MKHFFEFLTKLLEITALVIVTVLCTPLGWMGLIIAGFVYMMITGDRGTYP